MHPDPSARGAGLWCRRLGTTACAGRWPPGARLSWCTSRTRPTRRTSSRTRWTSSRRGLCRCARVYCKQRTRRCCVWVRRVGLVRPPGLCRCAKASGSKGVTWRYSISRCCCMLHAADLVSSLSPSSFRLFLRRDAICYAGHAGLTKCPQPCMTPHCMGSCRAPAPSCAGRRGFGGPAPGRGKDTWSRSLRGRLSAIEREGPGSQDWAETNRVEQHQVRWSLADSAIRLLDVGDSGFFRRVAGEALHFRCTQPPPLLRRHLESHLTPDPDKNSVLEMLANGITNLKEFLSD